MRRCRGRAAVALSQSELVTLTRTSLFSSTLTHIIVIISSSSQLAHTLSSHRRHTADTPGPVSAGGSWLRTYRYTQGRGATLPLDLERDSDLSLTALISIDCQSGPDGNPTAST